MADISGIKRGLLLVSLYINASDHLLYYLTFPAGQTYGRGSQKGSGNRPTTCKVGNTPPSDFPNHQKSVGTERVTMFRSR